MAKSPMRNRDERLGGKSLAAATVQCAKVRERIVRTRTNRGLTGTQVADAMGLSRPFYTQLEGGTRRMSLVYFLAICQALRVEPGELLK